MRTVAYFTFGSLATASPGRFNRAPLLKCENLAKIVRIQDAEELKAKVQSGYEASGVQRSEAFGCRSLRLGTTLVLTSTTRSDLLQRFAATRTRRWSTPDSERQPQVSRILEVHDTGRFVVPRFIVIFSRLVGRSFRFRHRFVCNPGVPDVLHKVAW